MTGWISPDTLLTQVRNTAPFLYPLPKLPGAPARRLAPLAAGPRGNFAILSAAETLDWASLTEDEDLEDYFALCLACHHTTVGTFVPTDVDSKIRGLAWKKAYAIETLRNMVHVGFAMREWSLEGISAPAPETPQFGPVTGHNGEWLSVMVGAHGRLLQRGDTEYAERTGEAIETELLRELDAFEAVLATKGRELDVLRLAMSITHNIGDVDQGVSFWESKTVTAASRARFGRLAHENTKAFGGRFQAVANLYKKALANEGHRHYPLRAVRSLRKSADYLRPLGPFFDSWGATLITHAGLDVEDRAEIIDALVRGCRKVPNQQGYYRALAGMQDASQKNFELASERVPAATRKEMRDPETRRLMAIPRASFESRMRKYVRP